MTDPPASAENVDDRPLQPGPMSIQIARRILERFPLASWNPFPTIVAVSGGADSVAMLLHLDRLSRLGPNASSKLLVAHVNHGLRGVEADDDERFVAELAQRLKLPFHSTRLYPEHSSEENLRDQRYAYLTQLAHQIGARLIATGHTADDQIETILFRIFRGTGISGLTGIQPTRAIDSNLSIFRPLLDCRRSEIEESLLEFNQPFRTDRTNSDSLFSRNFIRNELLPDLTKRFGPQVFQAIERLSIQAVENEAFINSATAPLLVHLLDQSPSTLRFDANGLATEPKILIRHLLRSVWQESGWPQQSITYEHWNLIAEQIIRLENATTILPGRVRCELKDGIFVLKNL